ncbi:flippase [Halorubrum sp. C191]|uniref:flippase n=1 Tax=Halorubrum sp. C191 TaxID=1383842 RepID=UPI0013044E4A|nr:flippase [Halorubrum sp. C191]
MSESDLSDFLSGTSLVFLGNIIGTILGFSLRIGPARLLGPEEYGYFVLGLTIVNFVGLISHLGIPEGLGKMVPTTDKVSKYVSTGTIIGIIFASLVSIVLLLLSREISVFVSDVAFEPTLIPFLLGIPLFVSFKTSIGVLRGKEDSVGRVLIEVVYRSTTVCAVVLGILFTKDSIGAGIGWTVAMLVTAVTGVGIFKKRHSIDLAVSKIAPRQGQKLLLFSLPLVLATSSRKLMQELDTVAVSFFLDDSKFVGYYDSAYTISRSLFVILWTFSFLFMPYLSKKFQSDRSSIKSDYIVVTRWISTLSLPIALLIIFNPSWTIEFIFGQEYAVATYPLRILAVCFISHSLFGPNRSALVAGEQNRYAFLATLIPLGFNIFLNIILVPRIGMAGAAAATTVSYILMNILYSARLYNLYNIYPTNLRSILFYSQSIITYYLIHQFFTDYSLHNIISISIIHTTTHILSYIMIASDQKDKDVFNELIQ